MKKKYVWFIAILITLTTAVFQRMTGPTYPLKGKKNIENTKVSFSLPRSAETGKMFSVNVPYVNNYRTFIVYKRYKTNDKLNVQLMKKATDNTVTISLPSLPAAGKYVYSVYYEKEHHFIPLSEKEVVVRFKNSVPAIILIGHIIFMFAAMLFSNLAGVFALSRNKAAYYWAKWGLFFIIVGGFMLGPIVQKYTFGVFWTGFPFGYDLTDNKILLNLLIWLISILIYQKTKNTRWILLASVITLIIYLIPHSLFGSELNYTTGAIQQG